MRCNVARWRGNVSAQFPVFSVNLGVNEYDGVAKRHAPSPAVGLQVAAGPPRRSGAPHAVRLTTRRTAPDKCTPAECRHASRRVHRDRTSSAVGVVLDAKKSCLLTAVIVVPSK